MMRNYLGLRPCTSIYLLLMGLTFFTWYASVSGLSGLTVVFLILSLSLLKGHLIGDYYMGLKYVSSIWRWIIVAWLVLPGSLIAMAFYITY